MIDCIRSTTNTDKHFFTLAGQKTKGNGKLSYQFEHEQVELLTQHYRCCVKSNIDDSLDLVHVHSLFCEGKQWFKMHSNL